MKALLIDAAQKTVKDIEVNTIEDINKAIGSDIFCYCGTLKTGDTLYCDDEGLLKNPRNFVQTTAYPSPIAGNIVVVGPEKRDKSTDVLSTKEEVLAITKFYQS